jgi:hypothetical protein
MQNSEKEFNPCDLCSPHEGCDNCRLSSLEEEIKKLNSQVEILSTDLTQQEWDLLTEAHVSAVERAYKAQAALEEMEKKCKKTLGLLRHFAKES